MGRLQMNKARLNVARKLDPSKNGKRGHAFENKVARMFGEWWCGDRKAFYRTSGSGSRKSTHIWGGDIAPCSNAVGAWPFCIETKKVQKWSIENFILGHPGEPLLDFMLQCTYAAQRAENSIPLLVCAKNHKAPIAFLYTPYFSKIFTREKSIGLYIRLRVFPSGMPSALVKKYDIRMIDFIAMPLSQFFLTFTREDF
jgi:hypothetical protein